MITLVRGLQHRREQAGALVWRTSWRRLRGTIAGISGDRGVLILD